MPRKARVVAPGVPHHVTQRGNRRQATFLRPEDYLAYLQLAGEAFAETGVQVWCWCLMPNHVHLIATPADEAGLAKAVGLTHLRYTRLINGRERWTGYLWQGRFASFPMDDDHLRQCVRYVGLNPVRAGLVERAVDWPWSSVRAHLGRGTDPFLTPEPVARLLAREPAGFFDVDLAAEAQRKLRKACRDGRPLGAADWVKALDRRERPELRHRRVRLNLKRPRRVAAVARAEDQPGGSQDRRTGREVHSHHHRRGWA